MTKRAYADLSPEERESVDLLIHLRDEIRRERALLERVVRTKRRHTEEERDAARDALRRFYDDERTIERLAAKTIRGPARRTA